MEDSYEVFKQNVLQMTRIDLNAYKERQMKRRIDALIEKNNMNSYADYVKLLRSDKSVFEEFVTYLTINVSEFYRNPELWEGLKKDVIPVLLTRNKQLKVWSAPVLQGMSLILLLCY